MGKRDLHHGRQRVSPFYHVLFHLQRRSSCCHQMNVFGRLLARDLCHGRQRVSPFYHVQQLLHEKNVFRSPGNGTFFLHLARSLGRSRQRVAPFYHDLDLDLVGLIENFWIVEQLVPMVVEQLLNPILSSSHVSRRSLEEADVTHILSRV